MSRRLLVVVLLMAPWLILFRAVLFGGQTPVFRDAGHFYFPLFQWIQQQWEAGGVPLWNPFENAGTPLLADASSSIFYPGKLLFFLPTDYPRLFSWYIALHSLLACCLCYAWIRRLQVSWSGAILGAWTYAYGGAVLHLHCNIVFLVGASWLPLAMMATDRICRSQRGGVPLLAAALALMVLGGDPQMAYLAVLLSVLWAIFHRKAKWGRPWGAATRRIAVACVWATALAAIQILPASEWSRQSERTMFEHPRSLYEVPVALSRGMQTGKAIQSLVTPPARESHHEFTYDFSVPLWRWIDASLPNYFGVQYPENNRWTINLELDNGIWSPSYFIGWIPIILGLSYLSYGRDQDHPQRWYLITVIVGGVLATSGAWGLGWCLNEVLQMASIEPTPLGKQVGGLFWLMQVALPGFVYFRYPAKLAVLVALAFAAAVGHGCDQIGTPRFRQRAFRLNLIGAAVAVVMYVFLFIRLPENFLDERVPLFGRYDLEQARWAALGQATLTFASAAWFLILVTRCKKLWVTTSGIGLATGVALVWSNQWLIATVPDTHWQQNQRTQIAAGKEQARTYLEFVHPPREFNSTRSKQRLQEILSWELQSHAERLNLLTNTSMIDVENSIVAQEWRSLLDFAYLNSPPGILGNWFLYLFGVNYSLGSKPPAADSSLPDDKLRTAATQYKFWRRRESKPRVWLATSIRRVDPVQTNTLAALNKQTNLVLAELFNSDLGGLGGQGAVVECLPQVALPTGKPTIGTAYVESSSASRLELRAHADEKVLLVIRDRFNDGWHVEVSTNDGPFRPVEILRTNRVMRGVVLSPGQHQIRMVYWPTSFTYGIWLSACGLIALSVVPFARRLTTRSHVTD